MSEPVPILSAEAVRKVYGGARLIRRPATVALDGVSLAVAPGAAVGLVGESGSGKTTLARIMAGLIAPDAGRVHWQGQPVGRLPRGIRKAFRRDVQYVFQNPTSALNPRQRVARILDAPLAALFGLSRDERRLQAVEALGWVAMSHRMLERYPHELSGGQAQRVAIARALAVRPRLLILDEPVSALDLSVQAQILELLGRLRRELQLAYLFITHDLAVVERLCEQIVVMQGGRIVEAGPRERVLADPRQDYTRRLIAAAPRVPGAAGS